MTETQQQGQIFDLDRPRSQEKPPCATCGSKLKGKQTRFCSKLCNTRFWDKEHPRIGIPQAPPPNPTNEPIRERIFVLLSDGRWYTDRELAAQLGILESTASAKRRDLRKVRYGRFRIQRRKRLGQRAPEYRVVLP